MKKNKLFKTVGVISALVGVFFLGAFTSLSYENMLDKFSPMFEILTYIDRNYYDIEKVDYDNILDEVLTGTMRGLEDPFAWYFDPVETKENEIDTSSKYGGIGSVVQYNIEFECLQVVSPMAGSPSERIGLRAGDLIITIDGTPVSETGYYESVNMLRGEPGTTVILEVYREGFTETKFFEITREIIEIKSVKSEIIDFEGSSISYIQITGFNAPTYEEFQNALDLTRDSQAYIFDLRNNPGGLLQSVLNISSLILPKGQRVITIRYRDGQEEIYNSWGSRYNSYFTNKPIVVLVNEGSASASEILTGALKDHDIATVIGTKTFGKAAVQTVYNLSNGGEIWLPTAHYFTPNGDDIHLVGIEPNITVEATAVSLEDENRALTLSTAAVDIENDAQLFAALEAIAQMLGVGVAN